MISPDTVARQISGAVKMAMGAEDWRSGLGRSLDDVFASFWAFALAAPLIGLAAISASQAAARIPDLGGALYGKAPPAILLAGDLFTFSIDWALSLTLLVILARRVGAGKQAAEIIIGYNWLQPVIAALQLPALAITAATASRTTGAIIGLPALALALVLIWGVVRRGLNLKVGPAVAVTAMLIIVGAVADVMVSSGLAALLDIQE